MGQQCEGRFRSKAARGGQPLRAADNSGRGDGRPAGHADLRLNQQCHERVRPGPEWVLPQASEDGPEGG
ncbi:hypothetical protein ON010_g17762 [Phytophthora cinnamomi]|nr:hypothetical protein ON010_g17762 [Phytophthora cinnamomi]